jgi:3-hydroxyacyl-CoA dehydrogenase/enoyl-CoA hydratase/3-hydroxybutyryl-CoA epimerase/3-hydroxyacyl-CoA dehydrogenase/enoyl-CoA hydratase/3-hydroxybutyryl-CoA epimerase/enoyl-CoA isomerase
LALGCDWRVATDSKQTFLGLPEVKLGLIPGWAGTVRLPRLIGLPLAAEYLHSGRNIPVDEALRLGLVDAVCQPDDLLNSALEILRSRQWQGKPLVDFQMARAVQEQPAGNIPEDLAAFRQQELTAIGRRSDIHEFAPRQLLDHLVRSCRMSFREACHSEALAMAEVYGSPSSRGLLNLFFLNEHNKKSPGPVDLKLVPAPLERLGIVGVGVMGQAIAQMAGRLGLEVWVNDISIAVCESLQHQWNHRGTLHIARELSELKNCQLIIEAAVESAPHKRELLSALSQAVGPEVIIATNTSAIPLLELQNAVQHPDRFCGIHFCHPQLMQLVEIVGGQTTSAATLAAAVHWSRQWRKTPVVVQDAPGFVVNRMLAVMLDASLELLARGNRYDVIDTAMREFGFPGGPFEIMDVIGLDTVVHAGREMLLAGHDQVSRSPIVPKLVKLGRLGRKTGAGFYRYETAQGPPQVDSQVHELLQGYQTSQQVLSAAELRDVILERMVNQAEAIVAAGLVADRRDIDLCMIYGLGFPAHVGGILFWSQHRDQANAGC